jgi:hypothetical protein
VAPVRQRTEPKIASLLFRVDRSGGRHFSDPIFLTNAWPEKAGKVRKIESEKWGPPTLKSQRMAVDFWTAGSEVARAV